MSLFVNSHGLELCKALKLPPMTQSVVIRIAVDELSTVTCTYYDEDLNQLPPILRKLELVEKCGPETIGERLQR